jgi:hypothetical protein
MLHFCNTSGLLLYILSFGLISSSFMSFQGSPIMVFIKSLSKTISNDIMKPIL